MGDGAVGLGIGTRDGRIEPHGGDDRSYRRREKTDGRKDGDKSEG